MPWAHLTLLLVLSAVGLWNSALGAPEKAKKSFSCLYWEGKPKEELFYRHGESMKPLEFSQATRSKLAELPGASSFELFRRTAEPKEDDLPFERLASAAIPSGAIRVLFLVIPFETEAGSSYRIVAMDDSLNAFPRGSFRFANFTSQPLQVSLDGKRQRIPSKELVVVTPKPRQNGGFLPFLIGNAKGETLFGTRLFGQPDGRELVFITPPLRQGGKPRVKFISQLVPPPAE